MCVCVYVKTQSPTHRDKQPFTDKHTNTHVHNQFNTQTNHHKHATKQAKRNIQKHKKPIHRKYTYTHRQKSRYTKNTHKNTQKLLNNQIKERKLT